MFELDQAAPDDDGALNFVPLIDVLLVALVFFVAAYQDGGEMPVPAVAAPARTAAEAPPAVLEVPLDGRLRLDGAELADADIVTKLRDRKPASVLIRGHEDVALKHVHRARSLCRQAGVTRLTEATRVPEPFAQ